MTPVSGTDLEKLAKPVSKGDKQAFRLAFDMAYVPLCLYAESIVNDRDVAEDIVQSVFCGLWENRGRTLIRTSFKSYLYRCVYHSALNLLKHDRIRSEFFDFLRQHGTAGNNEVEDLMYQESRDVLLGEVNRAVDRLPEQCREVFLLSRFSGRKSAEIAEIMHLSLRTVENHLYRATKQLRAELACLKDHLICQLFFFPQKD